MQVKHLAIPALGALLLGGANVPVPQTAYFHEAYTEVMSQEFHDQIASDQWLKDNHITLDPTERQRLLNLKIGEVHYVQQFIGPGGISTTSLPSQYAVEHPDPQATAIQMVPAIQVLGSVFNPEKTKAAVAWDNEVQAQGSAITTLTTASMTITGSNVLGVTCTYIAGGTAHDLKSVKMNGVATTTADQTGSKPASTELLTQSFIYAPTTGTVVYTRGSSGFIIANAVDYSGAAQSGQPGGTGTQSVTATSVTTSVTIVNANSWTVLCGGYDNANDGNLVMGANSTKRGTVLTTFPLAVMDNNGPAGATGSYSMTQTMPSSGTITLMAEIKPFVAAAAAGFIPTYSITF